ncbi:hypothetical protein M6B38_149510 [Iris pallida]|uniref:Uncharacterized protein n=1 Tax=Iris pallida TaxID=29817 RepID=A0AAX6F8D6_IRIPA|nr:hypothetical protein M6B38_149510 [Iris pallida]
MEATSSAQSRLEWSNRRNQSKNHWIWRRRSGGGGGGWRWVNGRGGQW